MSAEPKAAAAEMVDISEMPELLALVERARTTGVPLELRRGGETMAQLTPPASAKRRRARRVPTQADIEAFRSAAGSWHDVDVEAFKAYIRERRDASSRPPVVIDVPD